MPVNNTTVALTLLLAILGISDAVGTGWKPPSRRWWRCSDSTYYFLPPVGTLTIQDPQNWVALIAFLVTAVTASQLSARARRRTAEAVERRREIERLYALSRPAAQRQCAQASRDLVSRVVQDPGCEHRRVLLPGRADETFRSGPESPPISDDDCARTVDGTAAAIDAARGLAIVPVRLGGQALGSLGLAGPLPSRQSAAMRSRTWWPSASKGRARWRRPATPKRRGRARC